MSERGGFPEAAAFCSDSFKPNVKLRIPELNHNGHLLSLTDAAEVTFSFEILCKSFFNFFFYILTSSNSTLPLSPESLR